MITRNAGDAGMFASAPKSLPAAKIFGIPCHSEEQNAESLARPQPQPNRRITQNTGEGIGDFPVFHFSVFSLFSGSSLSITALRSAQPRRELADALTVSGTKTQKDRNMKDRKIAELGWGVFRVFAVAGYRGLVVLPGAERQPLFSAGLPTRRCGFRHHPFAH